MVSVSKTMTAGFSVVALSFFGTILFTRESLLKLVNENITNSISKLSTLSRYTRWRTWISLSSSCCRVPRNIPARFSSYILIATIAPSNSYRMNLLYRLFWIQSESAIYTYFVPDIVTHFCSINRHRIKAHRNPITLRLQCHPWSKFWAHLLPLNVVSLMVAFFSHFYTQQIFPICILYPVAQI